MRDFDYREASKACITIILPYTGTGYFNFDWKSFFVWKLVEHFHDERGEVGPAYMQVHVCMRCRRVEMSLLRRNRGHALTPSLQKASRIHFKLPHKCPSSELSCDFPRNIPLNASIVINLNQFADYLFANYCDWKIQILSVCYPPQYLWIFYNPGLSEKYPSLSDSEVWKDILKNESFVLFLFHFERYKNENQINELKQLDNEKK